MPGIDFSTADPRLSKDLGYSPRPGNPFADSNYPIPDFERVYNLMRDPVNGLKLADRRWRLIMYSKCFVGSEAVQWMVENLQIDRPSCVAMGERLMDAGIIHHVTYSEPFCDEYYFYRFQEDDESNILNMKRIWDAAIPTRYAIDVAKDLLTRLALLCEEHRKRVLAAKDMKNPVSSPQVLPPVTSSMSEATLRVSSTMEYTGTPNLLLSNMSPSLARNTNSPLPAAQGYSSPVLSMPSLHYMATSPTLISAPSYSVGDDIDYSTLAKSEDFRQYTLSAAELQRVQLVALNHDERIAFFVNCYNLLCLHAHVTHGPPNNLIRRWTFFRGLSYRIAGLDMTLDDIEHGILRGNKRPPMLKFVQQLRPADPKCQQVLTKRDGRIHFVISAGTRSDPPIRILDGENVQEELHEATMEFLSYSVKVDVEKKAVTLPRIFLWYSDDFPTPDKNLIAWVAQYLPVEMSQQLLSLLDQSSTSPTITHENFDWAVAEARFNASVVRRKRRKLELERSTALLDGCEQDGLSMQLQSGSSFFLTGGLVPNNVSGGFEGAIIPNLKGRHVLDGTNLESLFLPEEVATGGVNTGRAESGAVSHTSKTTGSKQSEQSEEARQVDTATSNA